MILTSEVEDIKAFTSQNIAKVTMKLELLWGGNSLLYTFSLQVK